MANRDVYAKIWLSEIVLKKKKQLPVLVAIYLYTINPVICTITLKICDGKYNVKKPMSSCNVNAPHGDTFFYYIYTQHIYINIYIKKRQ